MLGEFRGLGFDPAPGSPDAVMAASERCRTAADRIPRLPPNVHEWWTGIAASALHDQLGGQPAQLTSAQQVLRGTADVLDEWAATLLDDRRRAEQLDRHAVNLRRAIAAAQDTVDSAHTAAQLSADPGIEADRHRAARRHQSLSEELDGVLNAARELKREHLAAAHEVTERLRALAPGDDLVAVPPQPQPPALAEILAAQSRLATELAAVLPRARSARAEPASAAGAFAAALTEGPPTA
ncbi:hypothetical protein [Actinocrispum wychmicini]|uniref:Uncharacterized protein n=1 Tax=Actinocrispum wychmicini TaxID=1213861 RepID=A0A4V2S5P3_9PSEU|nr:hypothetical protein [Actinocrispum wychmicini]TCO52960.1 hypothetical protein EV192_111154 [Actinocrispum wychmicini]